MNIQVENGSVPIHNGLNSDFEVIGQSGPSTGMSYNNGNHSNAHPGFTSQISLTDMTLDEARQKLLEFAQENAELQRYMKENNEMMKRQYETLAEWKSKVQQANIANKDRFEQTKTLICKLRKENEEFVQKVTTLESEIQQKYKEVEDLKSENQLLLTQKQQSDGQIQELKQTLASLEHMKNKAEEKGEPEPNMDAVLIQLSLENEKKIEDMRSSLEKREQELKESRMANEALLNDLKALQKLKEDIQQDYQRVSRENIELSHQMEAGLTFNSITSVNWLQVTKKQGEDGTEVYETPSMLLEASAKPMEHGKTVEDLQQSPIEDLRKFQENKNKDYEDQISQLQKTVQDLQGQKEEFLNTIQSKDREIQELKTKHEQELAESSKLYEDKMAEFAKKLDNDREEQLKLQTSANENVESLKAQVIELMREVHELSAKIEAANSSIDRKNARIKETEEKYNKAVQDLALLEEEKMTAITSLQKRCQYLQINYSQEHEQYEINKNELTELRATFNRLIEDYRELLSAFDKYRASVDQAPPPEEIQKLKEKVNTLTCQLIVAEEALTMRDDTVAELKKEVAGLKEKVAIFKTQAEVFQMDFNAERQAREKQAQEKTNILQDMADLRLKNQQLVDEMESYSRSQLMEMQQRVAKQSGDNFYQLPNSHRQSGSYELSGLSFPSFQASTPPQPQQQQNIPGPADQLNQVEEHEFTCPKCNIRCPDLDSLEIHVVECMELD